jgi:hypothetical protein
MYNFVRFCGKLWTGVVLVKKKISTYLNRREGYIHLGHDEEEHLLPDHSYRHKTIYQKTLDYATSCYHSLYFKVSGRHHPLSSYNTYIPMLESTQNRSSQNFNGSCYATSKSEEHILFDEQLNDMCSNANIYFERHPFVSDSTLDNQYFARGSDAYQSVSLYPQDSMQHFSPVDQPLPFGAETSALLFDSRFISRQMNLSSAEITPYDYDPFKESNVDQMDVSSDTICRPPSRERDKTSD